MQDNKLPDKSPRELIDQLVQEMGLELMMTRRHLWLVLQAAGQEVIVDEAKVDPLWKISARRVAPGKLALQSSTIPKPTEFEIASLAEKLKGTTLTIPQATTDTTLADVNAVYLTMLVSPLVTQTEAGLWVPVESSTISP